MFERKSKDNGTEPKGEPTVQEVRRNLLAGQNTNGPLSAVEEAVQEAMVLAVENARATFRLARSYGYGDLTDATKETFQSIEEVERLYKKEKKR